MLIGRGKKLPTKKRERGKNEETARRFIYYFGADNAAEYIDWAAIGKQNPLADKGKD